MTTKEVLKEAGSSLASIKKLWTDIPRFKPPEEKTKILVNDKWVTYEEMVDYTLELIKNELIRL